MRARTRWMVVGMMAAAAPLLAQQGPGARGPQGRGMASREPGVARNIELALSRAETLGLDEARVQELRAMREDLARVREEMGRDVEAFREEARQQDREVREARRARARDLREQGQEALRPFQERYEGLLTEAQRTQVRQWSRPAGARGGRGAMAPGSPRMQRGGARVPTNRALAPRGERPLVRGRRIPPRTRAGGGLD